MASLPSVTGDFVGGVPSPEFPSPESRLLLTSLLLLSSLMFLASLFLLTSFLFLMFSLFRLFLFSLASLALLVTVFFCYFLSEYRISEEGLRKISEEGLEKFRKKASICRILNSHKIIVGYRSSLLKFWHYFWHQVNYDDRAWTSAYEIGNNGMAPWGLRPNIAPDAKWIWSSAVRGSSRSISKYFHLCHCRNKQEL